MGIFRQFPYSNFHEMNMDEIIKIVKTLSEEWDTTKTEWNSYKEFIDNYFENLNLDNEVLRAIRILAINGELNTVIDPVIISETTSWLESHITSSDSVVIDSSLSIEGAAADAKATGDAIQHVQDDLDSLATFRYWNLLKDKTPIERWFVDTNTGVGRALNDFFAFTNIDVTHEAGDKVYIYSSKSITPNEPILTCRNMVFYDANDNYISGLSGSQNYATNGYPVPNNAVKASITFIYETTAGSIKPTVYYASINRSHTDIIRINDNVQLPNIDSDTTNAVQMIRKPTFSFIFDDGTAGDVNIKSLFDSYNIKCGFALIANNTLTSAKIQQYLGYQNDGYEILSHSVDGTGFNDPATLTVEQAKAKMKNSLDILTDAGFVVNGWVTPNTWLNSIYFNTLCQWYQYGFGHLSTNPTATDYVHIFNEDVRQLERESLESNTVSQILLKIDNCIESNGFMCFYGHNYPSNDNNMTTENMTTILNYLKRKLDAGDIYIETPNKAINNYYNFRHSDYLNMI